MSQENGVTHYLMSSAFEVEGQVHVAGTILPAEKIESHPRFEILIAEEHIRPCDPPASEPKKPALFGNRRKKSAEGE
jgi:hypothetical protein